MYKCSLCKHATDFKYNIKRHIKTTCKEATIVETILCIECKYCKKTYKSSSCLNRHLKICKLFEYNKIENNEEFILENEQIKLENEQIKLENEQLILENEQLILENEQNEQIKLENEQLILENEQLILENEQNEQIKLENKQLMLEIKFLKIQQIKLLKIQQIVNQ